jgi:putative CocE/NonD family hydrolase
VDTDFTAKLIDVYPSNPDYPNGFSMNLTESILRVRYRNGFESPELMKPGEIYEITIELPAVSNLFVKGHQIRLDISSSSYPNYDLNPNTGDPYLQGGRCVVAENTVHHDAARPSHILLPVIPRKGPSGL